MLNIHDECLHVQCQGDGFHADDPYAVVASAVGTLGGLHGGANEEVIGMLEGLVR